MADIRSRTALTGISTNPNSFKGLPVAGMTNSTHAPGCGAYRKGVSAYRGNRNNLSASNVLNPDEDERSAPVGLKKVGTARSISFGSSRVLTHVRKTAKKVSEEQVALAERARAKYKKKLLNRYVDMFGYTHKVVILDVIEDFLKGEALNSAPGSHKELSSYKTEQLDAYLAKRMKGKLSTDLNKYSYKIELQKQKEKDEELRLQEERKRKFGRDCNCDCDAKVVRESSRASDLFHRRDTNQNYRRQPTIEELRLEEYRKKYGPDGIRPAGHTPKDCHQKKHYQATSDGKKVPNSAYLSRQTSIVEHIPQESNFLSKLYEEQIKQREERQAVYKVNKEAERLNMKFEQEKYIKELEDATSKKREQQKQQFEEYLKTTQQHQLDQRELAKLQLQQEMSLTWASEVPKPPTQPAQKDHQLPQNHTSPTTAAFSSDQPIQRLIPTVLFRPKTTTTA